MVVELVCWNLPCNKIKGKGSWSVFSSALPGHVFLFTGALGREVKSCVCLQSKRGMALKGICVTAGSERIFCL